MRKLQNLSGNKYGKLTVISFNGIDKHRKATWLCLCECGENTIASTNTLKSGKTKSCGCRQGGYKHGLFKKYKQSKEYNAWLKMKSRCFNQNDISHKYYKGITVYPEWMHSFQSFLNHIGLAPSKDHSLDRINNLGNYEPNNVKWSTKKEQIKNRRCTKIIEFNGVIKTLPEWSDFLGIDYKKLLNRINRQKWSVDRAFETP